MKMEVTPLVIIQHGNKLFDKGKYIGNFVDGEAFIFDEATIKSMQNNCDISIGYKKEITMEDITLNYQAPDYTPHSHDGEDPCHTETLLSLEQLKEDINRTAREVEDSINTLYEKYNGIDFKIEFVGYKAIGNNHVVVEIKAEV